MIRIGQEITFRRTILAFTTTDICTCIDLDMDIDLDILSFNSLRT